MISAYSQVKRNVVLFSVAYDKSEMVAIINVVGK